MMNSPSYAFMQLPTITINELNTTAQVDATALQLWLTVKNSRGAPEKPWNVLPSRKEPGNEVVDDPIHARNIIHTMQSAAPSLSPLRRREKNFSALSMVA
jgi:hypothetical protein